MCGWIADADTGAGRDKFVKDVVFVKEIITCLIELIVPGQDVIGKEPGAERVGKIHPGRLQVVLHLVEDAGGLIEV